MSLTDRVAFTVVGAIFGALIASAILLWVEPVEMHVLFGSAMIAGAVGGFFFGKQFVGWMGDVFRHLW